MSQAFSRFSFRFRHLNNPFRRNGIPLHTKVLRKTTLHKIILASSLLLLTLLTGCIEPQANINSGRNDPMTTLHHVGRFSFQLPNDYIKVGGFQSLYGINFVAEPAFEDSNKQFEKRQVDIQSKANKVLSFSAIDLGDPTILAAVYTPAESTSVGAKYIAQKRFGDEVLVAEFTGRLDKKAVVVKLFTAVMNGYSSGIKEGFVIGKGTLALEHSLNESALASFAHIHKQDLELTIYINTAADNDDTEHPLSDIDGEKAFLEPAGFHLEVIKNEERVINHVAGHERTLKLSEKEKDNVNYRFTWHETGLQKNALRPNILIKAIVKEDNYEVFQEDWELLLRSKSSGHASHSKHK